MTSRVITFTYQKPGEEAETREIFLMAETDTAIVGYDKSRVVNAEGNFDLAKWNRILEVFESHEVKNELPKRGKKIEESALTEEEREIKSFNVGWRRFNKDRIIK